MVVVCETSVLPAAAASANSARCCRFRLLRPPPKNSSSIAVWHVGAPMKLPEHKTLLMAACDTYRWLVALLVRRQVR